MKNHYRSCLGLIGALALAGVAYAQVPSGNDTSDGNANTGGGFNALDGPTATASGEGNTGYGYQVLIPNSGSFNTATGAFALSGNTSGSENTVSGYNAAGFNTSGSYNTATGFDVLYSNITGKGNSAEGYRALYLNRSGDYNTAVGYDTLYNNTTGTQNNAAGYSTLHANTTGSYNNGMGVEALYENTTGSQNSAVGYGALYSNTDGSYNAALGYFAGFNLTTGSNNVDISNRGVAGESGVTRIGTDGTQTAAYVAGIYGVSVTGSAVVVSSTGQLGVVVSSERFKTGIAPMGADTSKLSQLRPVKFHLKTDPRGALQYGLIAEEVAQVYPELVIRKQTGRIDGVRYDELAPMLLNEVQKQQSKNAAETAEIRDLRQQVAELNTLKQQMTVMSAELQKLQEKDALVVQR
jgi:ribosomal protein L29